MLERVMDAKLQEKIQKMILELISPKEAEVINFIFVTNVVFLGYSIFHEELKKYFIIINIKIKDMLREEEGTEIAYATLSHEIGHIKKDIELCESSCIEADEEALALLVKIYKNPAEVLLKQINYIEKNVLTKNDSTKKEKEMTASLAEKRRNALADLRKKLDFS